MGTRVPGTHRRGAEEKRRAHVHHPRVERYERENADGEFEVYEERIFHDGLPGVGLQFLFRTNRAVPIGVLTAAACTSWSVL